MDRLRPFKIGCAGRDKEKDTARDHKPGPGHYEGRESFDGVFNAEIGRPPYQVNCGKRREYQNCMILIL